MPSSVVVSATFAVQFRQRDPGSLDASQESGHAQDRPCLSLPLSKILSYVGAGPLLGPTRVSKVAMLILIQTNIVDDWSRDPPVVFGFNYPRPVHK